MKKEIKKLQKFRDQIKTWQLNDAIEAAIVPARLQEHRRLVEEAMERYKDVEKSSKMKSYSNQLIMLAALEQDENRNMTAEGIDCIEFLDTCIEELNEQNEGLESEYEKLNQKKTSKKNSSQFDDRKQEIDSFTARNNFHIEKLEHCIQFLRRGRIQADLVNAIRDDISFYIESNQEPDFIDDETLYDEIIKEAKKQKEAQDIQREREQQLESVLNEDLTNASQASSSSAPPTAGAPTAISNNSPISSVQIPGSSHSSSSTTQSSSPHKNNVSTPILAPQVIPQSPEFSSPAIIKTLKPATTPTKPVGALKWATAAASSLEKENKVQTPVQQVIQPVQHVQPAPIPTATQTNTQAQTQPESTKYFQQTSTIEESSEESFSLFQKEFDVQSLTSSLSDIEQDLFSDINLIKLPPGIQDLVVSFTASRKTPSTEPKYLLQPSTSIPYNQFNLPIQRPFLPTLLRSSFYPNLMPSSFIRKPSQQTLKPPPNLLKLQTYWNSIRTELTNFDKYVQQIQQLTTQATPELLALVNELTTVFFYGYYYGFSPLENFIAEQCLFQLGWKPYRTKDQQQQSTTITINGDSSVEKEYYHWFKSIKIHANSSQLGSNVNAEFGDYQVFDLLAWEIYVKSNFKFDFNLSQSEPISSL